MTAEFDPDPADFDPEATVAMPRPFGQVDESLEDVDPEQTIARDDWESVVLRRVAPRVTAVKNAVGDRFEDDRFGWESKGLRRLSQEVERVEQDAEQGTRDSKHLG